jgi:dihydrolipoamide dehydrogenase
MYDLAIIGGGPGGYVAAIRGAQQGLKVLLVEKDSLGGTCLNRGCISTKCFIHDGKILEAAKTSQVLTGAEALSIDLGKMVARKRQVVKTLVSGLGKIIQSHGIDVVQGLGVLIAPGRVKVSLPDGSTKEYQTRHVILATGSKPAVPAFIEVDGHYVQTTDEALDSDDIPGRLIIIGGGVIGVEMAGIYRTLDREVTILEMLPDILTTEDAEIRRAMRRLLEQRGVKVHLKARVKEIAVRDNGTDVIFEDEVLGTEVLKADRVLVATSRVPVLDGIDVGKLGLETDGPFVRANERLETNLPGVYAIGDLIGGMMLAHKASAEAEAAVANILGASKEVKPERIPRCIWGFTEIGAVGLTEEEARATGRPVRIGKFPFMNSGAAQALGSVIGFAKIIGDTETGEVLGFHIMGPHATDLIGESVLAMSMESVVEELAEAVRPHPTLSETVMEAAMDWSGLAIDSPKKST